jgi:hypothetical protein
LLATTPHEKLDDGVVGMTYDVFWWTGEDDD